VSPSLFRFGGFFPPYKNYVNSMFLLKDCSLTWIVRVVQALPVNCDLRTIYLALSYTCPIVLQPHNSRPPLELSLLLFSSARTFFNRLTPYARTKARSLESPLDDRASVYADPRTPHSFYLTLRYCDRTPSLSWGTRPASRNGRVTVELPFLPASFVVASQ